MPNRALKLQQCRKNRQKSKVKEEKAKCDIEPVVQCMKLSESDETYTSLCHMSSSTRYKRLQTICTGTPYTGPGHGTRPIQRAKTPHNLGNLKTALGIDNTAEDFTNTPKLEVVEEQQYSTNILPDAEVITESDMGYAEWCAAQGLLGLKAESECVPSPNIKTETSVQKKIVHIHNNLDVTFGIVQENIFAEKDQEQILMKLDAIAACVGIKPIIDSGSIDSSDIVGSGNGNGSNENESENEVDKKYLTGENDLNVEKDEKMKVTVR